MKITVYDTSNTQAKPHFNLEWTIAVERMNGIFYLSSGLRKGLQLKAGDHAFLAQAENGDWLVSFNDDWRGFLCRIGNPNRKYPNLLFSCKTLARKICDEVGALGSAKFLVSHKPTTIDGMVYYQILTKSPLRR